MTLEVSSVLPEQLWKFYNLYLNIIEGVREERIIIFNLFIYFIWDIFRELPHSVTASQLTVLCFDNISQFSELDCFYLFSDW